jgi:four helix bundle protein
LRDLQRFVFIVVEDSAASRHCDHHSVENSRGTAFALDNVMNRKAEELKQRTFTFGLRVITFCRLLRETWEGRELSDQLFRAGTRVGANYRAACRARSHADFVVKIGHVVEEADESVYWLEIIQATGISTHTSLAALLAEAGELTAIFSQSQLTAKANAGAYGTGASRRPNPQPIPNPKSPNPSVNP